MRRLEKAAGADAELEAAAAQQVERRRRLGEHGRRPERQVADIREDAHGRRPGEDRREQRQRVEVARLVGMVLNGEQVVAEAVDEARRLQHPRRVAGVDQEVAELERVAVVQSFVQRL